MLPSKLPSNHQLGTWIHFLVSLTFLACAGARLQMVLSAAFAALFLQLLCLADPYACYLHLLYYCTCLPLPACLPCSTTAEQLETAAGQLLAHCQAGLPAPVSYNVILTQELMLMVPRKQESCGRIAIK
jgi:hypothetical protein